MLQSVLRASRPNDYGDDAPVRVARCWLQGKNVALDLEGVSEVYATKADGHSFKISGTRDVVTRFVSVLIDQTAASVKPRRDGTEDIVIEVRLEVKMEGGGLLSMNKNCLAKMDVVVKDKSGASLGTGGGG